MVKNYTRPGFQFVPGNGRSTFLLSRAQSEPIVRDEYFKTNTRNFYPMFAQFSALRAPNVSMFHLTSVEALVVSLILSTPLPSAQRRISYFFVQIGGLTHQSRALIYRGAHWLSYCCGTYILYANRTVSQIQSSLRLYNVAIRLTTQVLIIMYPLG